FQPFRQAAATTTGKRGKAGSGFTIISRIAELLQGEIRLEQDASENSEITFAIATGPLTQVRMLSSQEAGELDLPDPRSFSANSRLQGRILVVEDNLDNQRLIRFLLNRAGAEITIAANGQQGVDMALQSESPFDLILMDLQMPVLDGYQATIALRAAGYTGSIVALTAHALTGELERCLSVGFDDCLTKPIDRNVLIPQIAARLARKSTSVTR
ncbi:MAG: response regulator, partial [Gimesia chilikensis]